MATINTNMACSTRTISLIFLFTVCILWLSLPRANGTVSVTGGCTKLKFMIESTQHRGSCVTAIRLDNAVNNAPTMQLVPCEENKHEQHWYFDDSCLLVNEQDPAQSIHPFMDPWKIESKLAVVGNNLPEFNVFGDAEHNKAMEAMPDDTVRFENFTPEKGTQKWTIYLTKAH